MPTLIARDLYNNPDNRANVIGVELEAERPIVIDATTGNVTFYVRYVTAFDSAGSSAATAVSSKQVTVQYDALAIFLQKLFADAKQQGVFKNGAVTVITATPPALPALPAIPAIP
jgi:flagellar basal body-associated protein FliL